MTEPAGFAADKRGALRNDRLVLGAIALALLGILAHGLLGVPLGALVGKSDPGVVTFAARLELASPDFGVR